MKYIGWLVFILICFPMGQAFHRVASLETLGGNSAAGGAGAQGKQKIVFETGGSELEVWIDPASVRESELPETVTLKRRMEVSSADRASVVPLEKDAVVRILGKSGNNLTVSALSGPLTGIVPLTHTDLLEQVVRVRAARLLQSSPAPVAGLTNPVTPPGPQTPAVAPPPVAQVDPAAPKPGVQGGGPKPPMSPPPVEPEPEPEPEPVADVELTEEQIIKLMQENIKAGSVKEFNFDQVQAWKMGEAESVDGEDYQVGMAAYKAETIFGVKTVQAKALIKSGKITKWVYAKTGMEIR